MYRKSVFLSLRQFYYIIILYQTHHYRNILTISSLFLNGLPKDINDFQIAEWLEEEGYNAEADVLESKLQELMKIITPVHNRYDDYAQRPDVLNTLEKKLNSTTLFLSSMKNFTEQLNATTNDPQYTLYTTVEINTLEKMINDTVVSEE